METLYIGLTLGVIGKVLVAISVVRVHQVMGREHKIDRAVMQIFHWEKIVVLIGIVLIIAGYVLEIIFYQHHQVVSPVATIITSPAAEFLTPYSPLTVNLL